MKCPYCQKRTPAWRSSGMSESRPHFYCDRCSNVICRTSDGMLVLEPLTQELLDRIAATLPDCPCGGRFRPGASPKCHHCGREMLHQADPVRRLHDPYLIVVDGACVFSDQNEPYRVRITRSPTLREPFLLGMVAILVAISINACVDQGGPHQLTAWICLLFGFPGEAAVEMLRLDNRYVRVSVEIVSNSVLYFAVFRFVWKRLARSAREDRGWWPS
jgi:hypothetical protein